VNDYGEDVEGSYYGLFLGTVQAFAWKDCINRETNTK
jgi:hypothetical protein